MIHSVSEQLKKMDLGCLDLGCVEKQVSQSSVDSDTNHDDSIPSSSKTPKSKKMDLGCLDLGCIEKQIGQSSTDSEINSNQSLPSTSKPPKNKIKKDQNQSSPRPLNRLSSQIKKPTRRKTSPLSWFPRKKGDSYLTRKLKLLQEVDGMNATLDETLGDTNPHFSKVLREKIAVKEAAHKAIEARKAALVEASWCRILHAARIESKEAESLLAKAEETATEAFESAKEIGVIMYDMPDCPTKHYKIEKSSENGEHRHTVTTSFDTAFDVDKQVAAALKAAFVRLSSCELSIGEAEFKQLLKKISQNPDSDEKNHDLCESESESQKNDEVEFDKETEKEKEILVDMMLKRLKCLKEEELASLATIVATCGLNAALAEAQNGGNKPIKKHEELPGLDKFLVKRLTRLEKEIQDAKNNRTKETLPKVYKVNTNSSSSSSNNTGLEGVLVKHYSKLEREIQEAKKNNFDDKKKSTKDIEVVVVPELGSMLKKHTSKLVKEMEEAKRSEYEPKLKRSERLTQETNNQVPSLGEVLVKRVSRLEREVLEAKKEKEKENVDGNKERVVVREKEDGVESLDKVLVKGKSRMERVKVVGGGGLEGSGEEVVNPLVAKREARGRELQEAWGGMSFGNSIRPGLSRLQREKAAWIKKTEEEEKGVTKEPKVV